MSGKHWAAIGGVVSGSGLMLASALHWITSNVSVSSGNVCVDVGAQIAGLVGVGLALVAGVAGTLFLPKASGQ